MTNAAHPSTTPLPALLTRAGHASSVEPTVIRQVIFPLRAFDHLKSFQRKLEVEQGISLTNNQVVALIFDQHAQHYPTTTPNGANHAE